MKRQQLWAAGIFLTSGIAHAADQAGGSAECGMFKVLIGLIIVLGMMAGSAWLLKRLGLSKAVAGSTIKIVGGVSVGNRERVLVLEVADQWIIVGVAPGRVNSLATLPRQEQEESSDGIPASNNFSVWLKQTLEKRNASSS